MKRFCCLILSLLFLMLPASVVSAEDYMTASVQTVRVGWYPLPGYMEQQTDPVTGEVHYTGYNFAFWEDIAYYTGWEYEFVEGDAAALYQQLLDGEIDLLPVLYSTQRAQEVLFPAISCSSVYYVLFSGTDSGIDSVSDCNGKTIAIQNGSLHQNTLEEYAAQSGITYTLCVVDTADDVQRAVLNGTADVGVMSGLWQDDRFSILARFAPTDGYYAAAPDRSDLLDELNAALESIKISDPNYIAKLESRFLLSDNTLVFSRAETAYLESLTEPIRFGLLPDRYPSCYLDEETGAPAGILRDIAIEIAKYAGLETEFVMLDADTFQNIQAHDVDFAAGAYRTEERLSDPSFVLTNPIFSTRLIAVVKRGHNPENSGKESCAILNSERPIYSQLDLAFQIRACDSYTECLDAVAEGECTITLISQYAADYYLQKPQYNKLAVISAYEKSYETCLMASADTDPRLVSIMNKCITAMTEDDIASVVIRNTTAKPYELTYSDIVYAYRNMIVLVVLFIVIVASLLAFNIRSSRRHISTLREANQHLAIAIEQAEHASAVKSEFTSRISHEIRTPLNIVLGNIAMAKKAGGNEQKVQECLDKSEVSAKHLLRLLNAVLDQSALESGRIKLAHEPFDLCRMMQDLAAVYYEQGKQKGVSFSLIPESVIDEQLVGDMLRLNQILINLLSNAMKFTPRGGSVTLRISQIAQQSEQVVLRFCVEDNGRGMKPEFLTHIFEPYEQADGTIAKEFGGSGLGLSITKQLVSLMDGTISVSSEDGKGSVFTVELPFGRKEEPAEVPMFSSLRVLLAAQSDETGLCAMLEHCGVSVSMCGYDDAPDLLRKTEVPYPICLIDCAQQEHGGADALRTAIRISRTKSGSVPMIVVLAYDGELPAYAAENAGVDLILHKPLFCSVLRAFLADAVGIPRAVSEIRPEQDAPAVRGRILLVEDNALNCEITGELLADAGYTYDVAENGELAVRRFSDHPEAYSLILMDVQMPVMDGYQATEAIRRSDAPNAKEIPIIAMTANASEQDEKRALFAGMNDHLAKPVDVRLLYQALEEYSGTAETAE